VLAQAVLKSITEPRAGARMVLSWNLGWNQIGLVLAAGVVLSLLVQAISLVLFGGAEMGGVSLLSPGIVALLVVSVIVQALLVLWIGRAFGGIGDAPAVAAAVTWVNLVQAVLLGVIEVVGVILPAGLVSVAFLAALVWAFWIFSCFVAEVHGFESPGRVMAASFGILIVIALVMTVLMIAAGVSPPGAE
jgi:hypothetical protein